MDGLPQLLVGGLGGLVVSFVFWAFVTRIWRGRSNTDIDELAVDLQRLSKVVRRISMRDLRQDALDNPKPPAELLPSAPAASVMTIKDQLRRRYLGGNSS